MTDQERADALVLEIGSMLVHDEAARELDWEGLALAVVVEEGMVQMHGFAYDEAGKPTPFIPDGDGFDDRFEELAGAMRKPDGGTWKAALLQVTRATRGVHFEFEYDDENRWKVTPANLEIMREAMRPK